MTTFWDAVAEAAASGEPALLMTVMSVERQVPVLTPAGAHLLVTETGTIGSLGSPACDSFIDRTFKGRLDAAGVERIEVPSSVADEGGFLQGGVIEVSVRPVSTLAPEELASAADTNGDPLIIFGATVVGEILCDLATKHGLAVTVVDDTGHATAEKYPAAVSLVREADPVAAALALPMTPATSVVCMSAGHRLDVPVAEDVLRRGVRYIGMIGSRGRVERVKADLAANGFTPEEIGQLRAPIGLPIGGNSAVAIAVSIMAELIQIQSARESPRS